MKLFIIKTYSFDELNEAAKKTAIESMSGFSIHPNWFDFIYEDAKSAGIKINSFDIDRKTIEGEYITIAQDTIDYILANHGKETGTYQLANTFGLEWLELKKDHSNGIDTETVENSKFDLFSERAEELEKALLKNLLREYLSMLKDTYIYLESDDAVKEFILANEYDFHINGNICNYSELKNAQLITL